jgi:hypothetical protein
MVGGLFEIIEAYSTILSISSLHITWSSSGIFLSQSHYILDLPQHFKMKDCKPVDTPLASGISSCSHLTQIYFSPLNIFQVRNITLIQSKYVKNCAIHQFFYSKLQKGSSFIYHRDILYMMERWLQGINSTQRREYEEEEI